MKLIIVLIFLFIIFIIDDVRPFCRPPPLVRSKALALLLNTKAAIIAINTSLKLKKKKKNNNENNNNNKLIIIISLPSPKSLLPHTCTVRSHEANSSCRMRRLAWFQSSRSLFQRTPSCGHAFSNSSMHCWWWGWWCCGWLWCGKYWLVMVWLAGVGGGVVSSGW